jgi:OOP family OmpA-OmpF porin
MQMRGLAVAAAMAIAALSSAAVGAQSTTVSPDGSFLLFFDWGKPDVTGDAAAVIDQAVAAYRQRPGDRLLIVGHTDRSGSASYNRLTSRRRAEAVRNELSRRGVPASAMRVGAYGEEQPIVPTDDGVREVQNRRVEIRLEPPIR